MYSCANGTAAKYFAPEPGIVPLLLEQTLQMCQSQTLGMSLQNTQIKPWLLNMHTGQHADEKAMGCRSDFLVEEGNHINMVWGFTLYRVLSYGSLDASECFVNLLQIPWVFPVSVYRAARRAGPLCWCGCYPSQQGYSSTSL